MSEKQTYQTTYTSGPEKETHIDVRKAKLMRTKAMLATAALTAGVTSVLSGLAHSNDSQPREELSSVHNGALNHEDAPQFENITVLPGDSEWSIAERVNGDADPRDTIPLIEKANPNVSADSVYAGDVYSIPVAISDHDFSK